MGIISRLARGARGSLPHLISSYIRLVIMGRDTVPQGRLSSLAQWLVPLLGKGCLLGGDWTRLWYAHNAGVALVTLNVRFGGGAGWEGPGKEIQGSPEGTARE